MLADKLNELIEAIRASSRRRRSRILRRYQCVEALSKRGFLSCWSRDGKYFCNSHIA
jgi:hypothetical protein